jgi:YVTN family beta-propeller protein
MAIIASVTRLASAQSFAYVVNQHSNNVSVLSTASNTVVNTVTVGNNPQGIAATPNGSLVYVTNSNDNTVSVIGTASSTVVATVPVGMYPTGVAVTPNGAFVYVTNQHDNTFSVISTASNTVTATVALPATDSTPAAVAFAPNGTYAYIANAQTISVISTASNTVTATVPATAGGCCQDGPGIAISPTGSYLYVALGLGNIAVISTATNQVVATVSPTGGQTGTGPAFLAITPSGAFGYAALTGPGEVCVFDTSTNMAVTTIAVGSFPSGVALTRSGDFAYVTNYNDSTVSVISTASNTVVATVPVGSGPYTVAITPENPDSIYSQLNGGNTFNGNQTVNGNVSATAFVGDGSGLTNVTAATANNSASLGGVVAGDYARLDIGNSFTGNEQMNGTLSVNGFLNGGGVTAGSFQINANLNTDDALYAQHTGPGNALHAVNTQNTGTAALFEANGASGATHGMIAKAGSPAGVAGTLQSMGGGEILSLQNASGEVASVDGNGIFHFAAGQSFPGGSGTITGVTAGTGLTGGGTSGTVTLSVNENVVAFQSDLTTGVNTAEAFATTAASTAQSNAQTYANSTFLPLTGGTLTGGLAGTAGNFSGNLQASAGTFSSSLSAAGLLTANGGAALPATGNSQTAGSPSHPLDLIASASNGATASNQTFRWQAVNADGASPSANLKLLFGAGAATPTPTNLSIAPTGLISFAPGQTFPSTGTITGVTAGSGLSGGGTSGNVSLSIPAGGVTNTMLINPSLTVTAGTGLAGGGLVTLGGTTTLSLAAKSCPAGNALIALPYTCSPFAGLLGNSFGGTQSMPGLTVSGQGSFGSTIYTNTALVATSSSGVGIDGNSSSNVGVGGTSSSGVGVYGSSLSGGGVYGTSDASFGVEGQTSSAAANEAAGVFSNTASTSAGNILLGQYKGTTLFIVDAKGDVTGLGVAKFASYSVSAPLGPGPSCNFTSGGGTGASCKLDTDSTNSAGIIIATTGTGPAGTGTITLTFSATFGTNNPVCLYEASDAGTGTWSGLVVMKDKKPTTTNDVFTWTNGLLGTTSLTLKNTYYINYHCFAK